MPSLPRKLFFSLTTYYLLLTTSLPAYAVDLQSQFLLRPGVPVASEDGGFPTLGSIVTALLPNALVLASIILLFLLAFGGFTIINSGGNPEQTAKGKTAITGAIIGFIVIFASYWIVQAIQVLTGIPILNAPF